jgi:hypothetical protein
MMLARSVVLLAAVASLAGSSPAAAGDTKTVVELFTSQGCSSCPPADKLLGELAKDQRLVALSVPVDYWDYLGWRDTLALHAHTMRQKAYADARGDRQVYTPQVVVNGVIQAIGSDRREIDRAVAAAEASRVPYIPVTLKRNGDKIEIEIAAGSGIATPIYLLAVACETKVAIRKGENRDKTITYFNAVRAWRRLGEWTGPAMRASVPVSELTAAGADALAILIQPGSPEEPGPIRGAAFLKFD